MGLYRRLDYEGYPSLVTTNVAERQPLFHSESAARMFIEVLREVQSESGFELLAYVAMPDHVHLIAKPSGQLQLGRIVQLVKGRFSRRYNASTGGSGPLWQSRYHERALRSEDELRKAIEYVHGNPVAAGLVREAPHYRWSSAAAVASG